MSPLASRMAEFRPVGTIRRGFPITRKRAPSEANRFRTLECPILRLTVHRQDFEVFGCGLRKNGTDYLFDMRSFVPAGKDDGDASHKRKQEVESRTGLQYKRTKGQARDGRCRSGREETIFSVDHGSSPGRVGSQGPL